MRLARATTVGGLAAVLTAAWAGSAGAAPPVRQTIEDEFSSIEEDFCDEEGLRVLVEGTFTGRLQLTRHGSGELAYFAEHALIEVSYSTVDEDDTVLEADAVTVVERVLSKDLHVVDNGDGTLTVVVFSTGNATVYGSDGKAIARNPGQFRVELLISDNGTPADPDDDEVIGETVLKESTGRSDPFCPAAVPELLS
jgi:hypothetical protein